MERPAAIAAAGLTGPSFHYWTGRSGHDYVHSVYRPHEAPQIAGATLILVKRRDERRIPLAITETGSWPALVMAGNDFQGALARDVDEVHLHVPAEMSAAPRICADIAAAARRPVCRPRSPERVDRPLLQSAPIG